MPRSIGTAGLEGKDCGGLMEKGTICESLIEEQSHKADLNELSRRPRLTTGCSSSREISKYGERVYSISK